MNIFDPKIWEFWSLEFSSRTAISCVSCKSDQLEKEIVRFRRYRKSPANSVETAPAAVDAPVPGRSVATDPGSEQPCIELDISTVTLL